MEHETPRAVRPARKPLRHMLPHAWKRRPDPFAPGASPQPSTVRPEDTAGARGGIGAAVLGAIVLLVIAGGLTVIFTDLFR